MRKGEEAMPTKSDRMATRADRIADILRERGGRSSVGQILNDLALVEGVDLDTLRYNASASATVRQDNAERVKRGQAKRFRVFERGSGGDEVFGYISLVSITKTRAGRKHRQNAGEKSGSGFVETKSQLEAGIASQVEEANSIVRKELKAYIAKLTWQDIESDFLSELLNALGFQDITITQPTKDGGQDARCTYMMGGLVAHEAVISAKHWRGQPVGLGEVQRIRGVAGPGCTPIIITSSRFTKYAIEGARRVPGQQPVVLIDGNFIINACIEKRFLVQEVDLELPPLFKFDPPTSDGVLPTTSL